MHIAIFGSQWADRPASDPALTIAGADVHDAAVVAEIVPELARRLRCDSSSR